ncbi:scopoletin glucosyltransferase-like, partial [Asparagus officinalis]|uniref:scopoletin glucosyltransferase-like n=1 Tax=Asparagus officinalis TaxID=4686 RepID=UPI00098E6E24
MVNNNNPLKILFFPFMAPGHMLPMLDMAAVFVEATILTTPGNASPSPPPVVVNLLTVSFPSAALREPFDLVLADLSPDCVVTDMFLPWTVDVAAERGIPRLSFQGTSAFANCAFDVLGKLKPLQTLPPEAEDFVLTGLPHKIKLLKSQIDSSSDTDPKRASMFASIKDAEHKSYGLMLNSFYELEPEYIDHYRNVIGRKAWHIGPLSLCNSRNTDVTDTTCTDWLNSKSPGSVVYVCFGSMADISDPQVLQLALGLEAMNRPFIWVMKGHSYEKLPPGYTNRNTDRGLVIKGWAPQVLILNHKSVGCFVTHCGWNSSLEAISAGKLMVTWPMFAEQFLNERLIIDVLGIGVGVGVKVNGKTAEEREV